MERSQEENTRNVLPDDPLEGMGDLSALDPAESEPRDQPVAKPAQTEAQSEMEPETDAHSGDLQPNRTEPEVRNTQPSTSEGDLADEASVLDQLIEVIDQEVESGLKPLEVVQPEPVSEPESQEEQYVSFSLAGTEYAVPIHNVTEIAYIPEVTPLPNVPHWILGVANLRGDLISTVDLRAFFGLERTTLTGSTRLLVGRTTNEDMKVGLLVDRAHGMRYLRVSEIEKPTADIESRIAPYLFGAYESDERLLVLLDMDRVLMSPKLRQFEAQSV